MTSLEIVPPLPDADEPDDLTALVRAQAVEIESLRAQHDVDQRLIAQLEGEMAVDKVALDHLNVALTTARRIGAAVGIVMLTRRVDEETAFFVLKRASQNSHRKVRDIAEDVLFSGLVPDENGVFPGA